MEKEELSGQLLRIVCKQSKGLCEILFLILAHSLPALGLGSDFGNGG